MIINVQKMNKMIINAYKIYKKKFLVIIVIILINSKASKKASQLVKIILFEKNRINYNKKHNNSKNKIIH